jgi:nickel-dependent lactate racemase
MNSSSLLKLKYGLQRQFSCSVEPEKLLGSFHAPKPLENPLDAIKKAFDHPRDFPSLYQAILNDDHVAIILDTDTPGASLLIAGVWEELSKSQVDPQNIVIVQPCDLGSGEQYDPRADLPKEIQTKIRWSVHNPDDESACAYLASTAAGERLYLSREVTEADVVVMIGQTAFDRRLGYRGTTSVLYPGLSNTEAIKKSQGVGHRELAPEDHRPLRDLNNEAAWLLGTQFTVQVVASRDGQFAHIETGEIESVYSAMTQWLEDHWMIKIDERPEMVIASVDIDAGGHTWRQVVSAISTARQLVRREGKIVLLTDLREKPGTGISLLKKAHEPRDCYEPLRQIAPDDQAEAIELLDALEHASIYLLSQLPSEEVEELHLVALESPTEAERLIDAAENCVFVESAQHAWGRIQEA